jgi:hypothetical protein
MATFRTEDTTMPTPSLDIPLLGLSDASLAALVDLLDKEVTTLGQCPQRNDSVARALGHLELQLYTAIREQEMRKRASDTLAKNMLKIGLLGLGISPTNPQPVPPS